MYGRQSIELLPLKKRALRSILQRLRMSRLHGASPNWHIKPMPSNGAEKENRSNLSITPIPNVQCPYEHSTWSE